MNDKRISDNRKRFGYYTYSQFVINIYRWKTFFVEIANRFIILVMEECVSRHGCSFNVIEKWLTLTIKSVLCSIHQIDENDANRYLGAI